MGSYSQLTSNGIIFSINIKWDYIDTLRFSQLISNGFLLHRCTIRTHCNAHAHAHAHTRTRPPTHSPSHTIPSHTCSIAASSFSDASLTRSRALVSSMSACSGIAADTKHGATVYSMIVSKMYCSVTEKKKFSRREARSVQNVLGIQIYTYSCTHTHTHTHSSLVVHVYTHVTMHTHTNTHTYTHTLSSPAVHVYTYVTTPDLN